MEKMCHFSALSPLSEGKIQEFQRLYLQSYGIQLSHDEAEDKLNCLLGFIDAAARSSAALPKDLEMFSALNRERPSNAVPSFTKYESHKINDTQKAEDKPVTRDGSKKMHSQRGGICDITAPLP
jgi:hypothetical protein